MKDFQCEICGRAFGRKSSLARHLQLGHRASPAKANQQQYASLGELLRSLIEAVSLIQNQVASLSAQLEAGGEQFIGLEHGSASPPIADENMPIAQHTSVQAKLDALASMIRALESELSDWRSGRALLPFDAEVYAKHPDSAPKLEAYVKERIQALSKYEVIALAEKHNLWPMQDVDEWLPDEGIKLRAYLPTGG